MIVEAGFIALVALAIKKGRSSDVLSTEEETMYREAFENIKGPNAPELFRKLAEGFEKYNHPMHAMMLRRRADYLDAPVAKKAERIAAVRAAMQSTNVAQIENIASWFEHHTATGIAADLRSHIRDIQNGTFPPRQPPKETIPSQEVAPS